jgi:hypothetical protein
VKHISIRTREGTEWRDGSKCDIVANSHEHIHMATSVQLKCTMLLFLPTLLTVHSLISKMCEQFKF